MKVLRIEYLLVLLIICFCSSLPLKAEQQALKHELRAVYLEFFNLASARFAQTDSGTVSAIVRKLSFLKGMKKVDGFSPKNKRKYLKNVISQEKKSALLSLDKQLSSMDSNALSCLKDEMEAVKEHLHSLQGNPQKLPKGHYKVAATVLSFSASTEPDLPVAAFLMFSDLVERISSEHCLVSADKESAFLKWDDVKSRIDRLVKAHPSIAKAYSLGKTFEGRAIPLIKISDNVASDENEPEVLFTSGMHPREQQPVVCLLSFLEDLLSGYGKDEKITRLINEREIWLVPLLNVDGRIHDFRRGTTAKLRNNWRKNRCYNPDGTRGVDINRNFPVRWVRNTKNCYKEDYPGSGPASEPETKALMHFISSHRLSIYVDIHSYMGATIVPRFISDAEAVIYREILHGIEKLQKTPYSYKEPHGSEVPAPHPSKGAGLGFVWAYCTQGVRSINIEVRGKGFYHTLVSCQKEYEANIRRPLFFLAQMCSKLKMPVQGHTSLISITPTKPLTPGALVSLKTKINGKFDYAVLVSHSAQVRVLSEYRLTPSINGFTVKIMPKTAPASTIPMTLYTWDSNRGRSVINFDLKIN